MLKNAFFTIKQPHRMLRHRHQKRRSTEDEQS